MYVGCGQYQENSDIHVHFVYNHLRWLFLCKSSVIFVDVFDQFRGIIFKSFLYDIIII